MKTAHVAGGGVVRIVEAAAPEPGAGEVLIRIRYSALCGSELHAYRGPGPLEGNSGHEAVGVVQRVGRGVTRVRAGERVGISAVIGCGLPSCAYCARGQSTWCPDLTTRAGAHAEQFVTAERACIPIPEQVPDDAAVLLAGDGLGVPYRTSAKLPPQTETVAVFGAGPIGLGNVMMQSFHGRRVAAVDLQPYRLAYARKLGAACAVDARDEDPVAAIRAWAGGAGADACIEAAGRPETLKQCFAAVRPGGLVVMNGEQPSVPLSPSEDFIRRDITAVGSWYYQLCDVEGLMARYRDGLPAVDLVSHVLPFAQIDEAFRLFAAGQTAKVLLRYAVT